MSGKLYIVATPIGNLEDITYRAVRVLKEVSLVACEDTRVTNKLFNYYDIDTKKTSIHHHSKDLKLKNIIDLILKGESVAYVSDAGTPGISDPGNKLVQFAIENDIEVLSVPGPSATTAIASVAGVDMQKFCFLGFVPHKKGRKTFFEKVCKREFPVIYFDSVHRIVKNLEFLEAICGEDTQIILGRELTKKFEEVLRGRVLEVVGLLKFDNHKLKGEFVVVVV